MMIKSFQNLDKNRKAMLSLTTFISISTLFLIYYFSNYSISNLSPIFNGDQMNLKFRKVRVANMSVDETRLLELGSNCECKKHQKFILTKNSQNLISVYMHDTKLNITERVLRLIESQFYSLNFTCNLYSVLRRGFNQRVVSYSLFGRNGRYTEKLKWLGVQINKLYPGWFMRVYHDNTIDPNLICETECWSKNQNHEMINLDNSDFCNISDLNWNLKNLLSNQTKNVSYVNAAKWRWLPLADNFVDVMSSRDSDSYIYEREVSSAMVWMNSSKIGHIMRDNPSHDMVI